VIPLEAGAAPGSLASVRPFGLPLLRIGRGSTDTGIEPVPALPCGDLATVPPGRAAVTTRRTKSKGRTRLARFGTAPAGLP